MDEQITLGQALEELKHEFPYLSKLEIKSHCASEELIFLLVPRRHRPMLVGEAGGTADCLAAKIGKRVRVIAGDNEKEIAEEVLYPVKIMGIDTVFAKDDEHFRVRITEEESKRLVLTKNDAEKVLSTLLAKKTVVELE